jgi:hypothetical protein
MLKQNGQQNAVEAIPGPTKRGWTSAYRKIQAARQDAPLTDFYRADESDRLQRAKRWIAQARGRAK